MKNKEKIIFAFVHRLKRFRVNRLFYCYGCSRFGIISVNGHYNIRKFKRKLEDQFARYKYIISYGLTSYEERVIRMILKNVRYDLISCKKTLMEKHQKRFSKIYPASCFSDNIEDIMPSFSRKRYKTKAEFNHHKVHLMYKIQIGLINKALELISNHAVGINLTSSENTQICEKTGNQSTCNSENDNSDTNVVFTFKCQLDFTALVYSLFEQGYINNGKGEITKIHNEIARKLGIKLSDNWQSNLSKSVHKTNLDYMPRIFSDLKNGFEKYREDMIERYREL